eukprot:15433209-Alexandrium_andersonii.AAC.1
MRAQPAHNSSLPQSDSAHAPQIQSAIRPASDVHVFLFSRPILARCDPAKASNSGPEAFAGVLCPT